MVGCFGRVRLAVARTVGVIEREPRRHVTLDDKSAFMDRSMVCWADQADTSLTMLTSIRSKLEVCRSHCE